MLKVLQSMPIVDHVITGVHVMIKELIKTQDDEQPVNLIMDVFTRLNFFEAVVGRVSPSTNNRLEGYNRYVKSHLRKNMTLQKVMRVIEIEFLAKAKHENFKSEHSIDPTVLRQGRKLHKRGTILEVETDTFVVRNRSNVPEDQLLAELEEFESPKTDSFTNFCRSVGRVAVVSFEGPYTYENWMDEIICSCSRFHKQYVCKHCVCIAVHKKFVFPSKSATVSKKRKFDFQEPFSQDSYEA